MREATLCCCLEKKMLHKEENSLVSVRSWRLHPLQSERKTSRQPKAAATDRAKLKRKKKLNYIYGHRIRGKNKKGKATFQTTTLGQSFELQKRLASSLCIK